MLGWFGPQREAARSSLVSGTLDHERAERETGFKPRAPQSCDSAAGRDLNKEAGVLSSPLSGTDPALQAAGAVGLAQGAKRQPLAGSLQGQGVEAAPLHAGLQVFHHPHC